MGFWITGLGLGCYSSPAANDGWRGVVGCAYGFMPYGVIIVRATDGNGAKSKAFRLTLEGSPKRPAGFKAKHLVYARVIDVLSGVFPLALPLRAFVVLFRRSVAGFGRHLVILLLG